MILKVTDTIFRGDYNPPDDLKKLGIKTILSLEYGFRAFFQGSSYAEDEAADDDGLTILHEPMSDLASPTKEQTLKCLAYTNDPARLPIFVHCAAGVDRTGWVCAAYRVLVQGWSVDDAVTEWKALGFHYVFYFWWEAAFRKLMAELIPYHA